jgi:hypothetical protein
VERMRLSIEEIIRVVQKRKVQYCSRMEDEVDKSGTSGFLTVHCPSTFIICLLPIMFGDASRPVSSQIEVSIRWSGGTMLQAGGSQVRFPMRSLNFFN